MIWFVRNNKHIKYYIPIITNKYITICCDTSHCNYYENIKQLNRPNLPDKSTYISNLIIFNKVNKAIHTKICTTETKNNRTKHNNRDRVNKTVILGK